MKKEITFEPAYDKRHTDPKKNYGIHGVNLRFVLSGGCGAVQFVLYTNWQLPHVQEEFDHKPVASRYPHLSCHPMPADLGYHSPVPQYEGQSSMGSDCEYVEGDCYYDGSSLNAQPVYETLLKEGHEGVWRELEEYYNQTFMASPQPPKGE